MPECPCGRDFPKSFGLRVHQRTCPSAPATTPERHRDGPDQADADQADPNENTFDPAADDDERQRR
jgi:hypothetical protein